MRVNEAIVKSSLLQTPEDSKRLYMSNFDSIEQLELRFFVPESAQKRKSLSKQLIKLLFCAIFIIWEENHPRTVNAFFTLFAE